MQVVIPHPALAAILYRRFLSLFELGAFGGILLRMGGIPDLLEFENPENHQGDRNGNQQEFHVPAIIGMNGRLDAENPGTKHRGFLSLTKSGVYHPHFTDNGFLFSRASGRIIANWGLIGWTDHSLVLHKH